MELLPIGEDDQKLLVLMCLAVPDLVKQHPKKRRAAGSRRYVWERKARVFGHRAGQAGEVSLIAVVHGIPEVLKRRSIRPAESGSPLEENHSQEPEHEVAPAYRPTCSSEGVPGRFKVPNYEPEGLLRGKIVSQ